MPTSDIQMKKDDTSPKVLGTLRDKDGMGVDISGATLRFIAATKKLPRETLVDAVATNGQVSDGSDGSKGKWSYAWQPEDTAIAGDYQVEVEVTYADGSIQTFPTVGYLAMTIADDLGGTV